jgi:hypothetical protein
MLTQRVPEELCALVRVKLFANPSMATTDNMSREASHWIEAEGGVTPPGNGGDAELWEEALAGEPSAASADDAPHHTAQMTSPFSRATVRTSGCHV